MDAGGLRRNGADSPEIDGVEGLVEIGRGGFGVVYRGVETDFGREVAVKVLTGTSSAESSRRFDKERRAMGALSGHPNIVTVYRSGTTAHGHPYLVMELLSGGSLQDHLQSVGPMMPTQVGAVGIRLADALEAAHRAGVLHRDIKPANIFQSATNDVTLGDFGIAQLAGSVETQTVAVTASIDHVPPEVIAGSRHDERSDVYSLASTLYELVAGRAAFADATDESVVPMLARIATAPVPPPPTDPADQPIVDVIVGAMAKEPAARPQTAGEFAQQLRDPLNAGVVGVAGTGASTPADAVDTADSSTSRPRWLPVGLALPGVGVLGVAGLVIATRGDTEAGDAGATIEASTEEMVRVTDSRQVTSIEVPRSWADVIVNAEEVPDFKKVIDFGGPLGGMAIGGTFGQIGGAPANRDFRLSGVTVMATRRQNPATTADDLLDSEDGYWDECSPPQERFSVVLPEGPATIQQYVECDGLTSVAIAIVFDEFDPDVFTTVVLQIATAEDLNAFLTVMSSLDTDAALLP